MSKGILFLVYEIRAILNLHEMKERREGMLIECKRMIRNDIKQNREEVGISLTFIILIGYRIIF